MKALQFISVIVVVLCTQACANNNTAPSADNKIDTTASKDTLVGSRPVVQDSFAVAQIIDRVVCTADATQSYALYIPAKGNHDALPIMYCFDPHAVGVLPLKKYKALADTYGFILVGSNNSKNGNDWLTTEGIWNTLFNDTKQRLKLNTNRIYTCGFSGGAKVAGYVALKHPDIKGVIANGAGIPDGTPAGNYNFSFTAVAGEGDMNMTDLVAIHTALDKTSTRHRIILFNGKHAWAPEKSMRTAFAGLQFDAMLQQLIPKDEVFINNYIAKSKKEVEVYNKTNNLVKAAQECRLTISLLEGLTGDVNWFKQKESSLTNNATYKQQWEAQQKLLATEQQIKAQYMQRFQQGDMNYFTKTITDLQAKAKATTAEGAMYQRLLAYLSLAFYSISNQLINNNQNNDAQYVVELYKMADPANSEAWYFSAIVHARNSDTPATEKDLLKAVHTGFTDKSRLEQQPEFQKVLTPASMANIESNMNKN